MKSAISLLVVVLVAFAGALSAQGRYPAPANVQTVHVVLLLRGPNSTAGPSTPELEKLQAAHIAHLTKLGQEGHAYIAGPMGVDGDLRGIILMKAASADAARALEADDPAVKAGRLKIEVVSYMSPANWFSFAPIPAEISMRQFVFGYLTAGPKAADAQALPPTVHEDHLASMWAMRDAGVLVAGGPIVNGGNRAGVVIFALDSVDKARALLEQDPGVKAGLFGIELYPWYAADHILKGK